MRGHERTGARRPVVNSPVFCSDSELAYLDSRTRFCDDEPLLLDESYRLAHLPLVAPAHPKVIARIDGRPHEMGRHELVVSLVLPVPGDALRHSPAYGALEAELMAAPFASKIAWSLLPRRQDRLHATICSSRANGRIPAALEREQRSALGRIGPVSVELRGLFSGNVNLGRLYLRAYPEKRDGINLFHHIQEIMGCSPTDLYVVGLYNLLDDLDAAETRALSAMIERWWDKTILRFDAEILWLLGARDNLILDSEIIEKVALG